ncbi:MAG: hypothetical protein AAGA84_01695 [Pseudomonadota bacterium]
MDKSYCHVHNLVDPSRADAQRPWGIRVTAPSADPFNKLVGGDWSREHWYASEAERDAALAKMRTRHGFYRIGDDPSIILTRINANETRA